MNNLNILDVCAEFGIEVGPHNKALCPLHEDKRPSMQIYPDTNSFYCWVCQKGGDAVRLKALIMGVPDADILRMNGRMNKEQARDAYRRKQELNEKKQKRRWLNEQFLDLCDRRDLNEFIIKTLAPLRPEDKFLAVFAKALHERETINHYIDWVCDDENNFYEVNHVG
jgi:DNA primase